MTFTIREVEPDLHRNIKTLAAIHGTSIQALVIELLEEFVASNRKLLPPKRSAK